MSLYHWAVIKAYNNGDIFVRETHDVGFKWGTKWEDEPQLVAIVERLEKRFDIVKVSVRDGWVMDVEIVEQGESENER